MNYPGSSKYPYWALIFAAIFCCLVGIGVFLSRGDIVPFFMARPSMNSAIVAVGFVGLVLSLWELLRIATECGRLSTLTESLIESPDRKAIGKAVDGLGDGLVKDRCERILHAVNNDPSRLTDTAYVLADAAQEAEDVRGTSVRYLIAVMVFLGLLGTFWGLLITVGGVKEVLQTLDPDKVEDVARFITELKSSLGELLGGMSTAFSTSLFGLGGSIVLGFVEMQARQSRARFLADLDRVALTLLLPALHEETPTEAPPEKEVGPTSVIELSELLAAQREANARSDKAGQVANEARLALIESVNRLSGHTEKLIEETQQTRRVSEGIFRELLDQWKNLADQWKIQSEQWMRQNELTEKLPQRIGEVIAAAGTSEKSRRSPQDSGEEDA